ncbi:unnamed protein product, partial [Nesidiocoris tenuis]
MFFNGFDRKSYISGQVLADILGWTMSETRFAMEGKLLFAQSADGTVLDISKARLRPVDAVLVILGTVNP